MCHNTANCLVGSQQSGPPEKAWVQVYRAVGHGAVGQKSLSDFIVEFPRPIREFAEQAFEARQDRHGADYDPTADFTLSDASAAIRRSRSAIESLRKAESAHRKAFAVFVLLGKPKR